MPATHKRRRKLRIGERLFLFWDDDWSVHVASEDKRFAVIVRYLYTPWDQRPEGFLPMKVCGPEFPALEEHPQRPLLVAYSETEDFGMTPGAVRRLIDWCLTPGQRVRVLAEGQGTNDLSDQEEKS